MICKLWQQQYYFIQQIIEVIIFTLTDGIISTDLGNVAAVFIEQYKFLELTGPSIEPTGCATSAHVFGSPSSDLERCEEICAKVSLSQDKTLDDLKTAAMERMQNWELPRHWQLVSGH